MMPTPSHPDNGLIHLPSHHSVKDTLARLQNIVRERGLTVFARIDHSGAAAAAGLEMRPTEVLLFGSPKAGTPVMIAAPSTAIDLPLKALVWQDAEGRVWLTYNTAEYLQHRHGFPAELLPNLAGASALLEQAAARE